MTKEDFKVGAYVYHIAYGYGQILAVELDKGKVTIQFDYGEKDRFTIEDLIKSSGFRFV